MEEELRALNQEHLFEGWPQPCPAGDRKRFFKQLGQLNASYPGGVAAYVESARKLLADSKAGVNPLDGWIPTVPTGESLEFGRHRAPQQDPARPAHPSSPVKNAAKRTRSTRRLESRS